MDTSFDVDDFLSYLDFGNGNGNGKAAIPSSSLSPSDDSGSDYGSTSLSHATFSSSGNRHGGNVPASASVSTSSTFSSPQDVSYSDFAARSPVGFGNSNGGMSFDLSAGGGGAGLQPLPPLPHSQSSFSFSNFADFPLSSSLSAPAGGGVGATSNMDAGNSPPFDTSIFQSTHHNPAMNASQSAFPPQKTSYNNVSNKIAYPTFIGAGNSFNGYQNSSNPNEVSASFEGASAGSAGAGGLNYDALASLFSQPTPSPPSLHTSATSSTTASNLALNAQWQALLIQQAQLVIQQQQQQQQQQAQQPQQQQNQLFQQFQQQQQQTQNLFPNQSLSSPNSTVPETTPSLSSGSNAGSPHSEFSSQAGGGGGPAGGERRPSIGLSQMMGQQYHQQLQQQQGMFSNFTGTNNSKPFGTQSLPIAGSSLA